MQCKKGRFRGQTSAPSKAKIFGLGTSCEVCPSGKYADQKGLAVCGKCVIYMFHPNPSLTLFYFYFRWLCQRPIPNILRSKFCWRDGRPCGLHQMQSVHLRSMARYKSFNQLPILWKRKVQFHGKINIDCKLCCLFSWYVNEMYFSVEHWLMIRCLFLVVLFLCTTNK